MTRFRLVTKFVAKIREMAHQWIVKPKEDELIPTRASLLSRIKQPENHEGWQQFFDTYWKLIYGVARKAGLADADAQDVVQETMVSVAKQMLTFKYDPARGSFKAWMLNKTRWLIIDRLRKRRTPLADLHAPGRVATGTDPVENVPDGAIKSVTEVIEEEWQNHLLHTATLNVKRRADPQKYQMFDFCVYKEWPSKKVAEWFRVSPDEVHMAKHRITKMIKEEAARLEKEMT